MAAPVRRLIVSHSDLPQSVGIDLPWDSFSSGQKDVLDALDVNDDGTITYSPGPGDSSAETSEARHGDGSAERLQRVLWGHAFTHPHNQRALDRGSLDDRWRRTMALQDRIFDGVVQPLLGDGSQPERWRLATRILSESADFIHLHRLAVQARGRYERTSNVFFLRQAQEMLFAAKRFASRVRAGRLYHYPRIQSEIAVISPLLDRIDREQFREATRGPYLMAAIGSPITADLATLHAQDGTVTFAVAVPRSFLTASGQNPSAAVLRYFNDPLPVSLRASSFRGAEGGRSFRLTAVGAEQDAPGSADDPRGPASSYHLLQDRLQRTVFNGFGEMAFYRVRFRLRDRAEATDLMGGRPIRRFDVVLGNEETPDNRFRRIPGGLVVQNMAGTTSHDVFASDVHVHEGDYEIVRVMADSLRSLAARYEADRILPDQVPVLRNQAEEVERFFESINEQVEAAVSVWNEAFRNGEIHRVFLAGDLADFVNIAGTMERQGYHSTNVRLLREILGRLEAPLFVVSGNHDHHGYHFPLSLHRRNFVNAGSLQDLYEMHYDHHRFPGDAFLYTEGVKALLPRAGENWFPHVVRVLSADDPFGPPNDDFLDHHLRELGTYETYGVGLGNGFRVFAWPTETEHFNYARYLLEEVHDPVAPAVIRGITTYIGRQHVNGIGPRPETFVAFLREIEFAQSQGQRLVLMGHYPTFYAGEGPEQTPDSVDTLRGDAAWAVRMASWYYRRPNGEAVMPLSVAGHVHRYGESDFRFHFADTAEENRFRTELGRILQRKNAATLLDDLHHLRHSWDLDNRIEIRRVQDPGSNGLPGPILSDLNQDSASYCRRRGTAFLNLPSLGIPSGDGSGYVVVSTHPGGRIDVSPRLLRVGPDARIVTGSGRDLEAFRRARWQEARDWDAARTVAPFAARTQTTAMTTSGPGVPGGQPHWDFFPLVYQYPRRKIALTLDAGIEWDWRTGRASGLIGGQLLFPLTSEIHTLFGGPNYLAVGAEYSGLNGDLRARLGLDWGILTTYLMADRLTSGRPFLGGEVLAHGIFPHAGVSVWGGSTLQGDWGLGLGFRITLPLVTYRIASGEHPHH